MLGRISAVPGEQVGQRSYALRREVMESSGESLLLLVGWGTLCAIGWQHRCSCPSPQHRDLHVQTSRHVEVDHSRPLALNREGVGDPGRNSDKLSLGSRNRMFAQPHGHFPVEDVDQLLAMVRNMWRRIDRLWR
jgi:hypothetical protein